MLGAVISLLSANGLNLVEWEADFVDQFGEGFIWVAIGAAVLVAVVVTRIAVSNSKRKKLDACKEI